MEPHTAGDPISGIKWSRKSTRAISLELDRQGHPACPQTVSRLLQQMDYSLKRNVKAIPRQRHPDRNRQFMQIARKVQEFRRQGLPVLSVDTKKKELVGDFSNAGRAWCREPTRVNDHDFLSDARGKAIPYGIYDVVRNRGVVAVGTSGQTAAFAVDAIRLWYRLEGRRQYPDLDQLLLLADNGGCNGSQNRLWKLQLQKLADDLRIPIKVAHYPPGASKWNPIEHRMFSFISHNWAGQPLSSYETVLNFIRTTKTKTGLAIKASLLTQPYATGIKVSDQDLDRMRIRRGHVLPKWNYTLCPAQN